MRGLAAMLCLLAASAAFERADAAPGPKGAVILSATGAVGSPAEFDLEALKALPSATFATSTPWTKGVVSFQGVELKDVIKAIGAHGKKLRCVALNDYAIDIPVSDAVKGGPMIAYLSDGKPMSVRDKGPLWIVYPYDSSADYRNEVIYSRSIWQLRRIDVIE